ncbi:MAG: helix-turn-helix domain-containing protein [Terracidiphilus sp.]
MSKQATYAQWSLEPYCIGMKLRALRTAKRLTLSRLAAETGLSTALLSKLETDRMIPTLPTLATISRVYGVGLSYFFSEPERHSLSITRKAHVQSGNRGVETARFIPLNVRSEGTRLAAHVVEFPVGAVTCLPESARDTSVVAYVLEGKLELEAAGMHEQLDTGDCICFETQMPISWNAAGKHACRVLMVTPAGQHTGA